MHRKLSRSIIHLEHNDLMLDNFSGRQRVKGGTAKWTYDGVCSDPAIFGMMMNLDGPPTFEIKNVPVREFEDIIGGLDISARYVLRVHE